MTDIHALIRAFLQHKTAIPLLGEEKSQPEQRYTKAGIVPFMHQPDSETLLFYVVKPRSTLPDRGEPPFQICKGTRQHLVPGVGWSDMRGESSNTNLTTERLMETAMREGIEELGLKLDNVLQLFDMGGFGFSSVTTGKSKQMWLFAAEMADAEDFLHDRDIALTTADRKWLTSKEFAQYGRDDHRYILPEMQVRLERYLKENP